MSDDFHVVTWFTCVVTVQSGLAAVKNEMIEIAESSRVGVLSVSDFTRRIAFLNVYRGYTMLYDFCANCEWH